MKVNKQGLPELGPSARTLGVRPGIDVPASKPGDMVQAGQGGLSVSPNDPRNLPVYRRPVEFQGTGKDPVWMIDEVDLAGRLSYRTDPSNPNHGFIEPAQAMPLDQYEQAVEQTQPLWQKVTSWPATGGTSDDNG